MIFKLNDALDIPALKAAYGERKILQIKNIFPEDLAEKLYDCLAGEVSWGFQYMGPGGARVKYSKEEYDALSEEKKTDAFRHIHQTAADQFQYMYFFYPLTKSYQSSENPEFLLHQLLEYFNSEAVLEVIREITGIPELIRADALATKYTGNCFLHSHMDKREENSRRVAYVVNMTKGWQPNWGGYLQFFKNDLNIERSFLPAFNTLNIFTVPKGHSVGVVPPFCPGERLSVAGWFRDA